MVMEPGVFDYIDGDDQPLEREPFERLAADGQMMGYIHAVSYTHLFVQNRVHSE